MKFTHIHHLSKAYYENFLANYAPVIILNTGRSGSALLYEVLSNFQELKVYHEAPPNLMLYADFAYKNQSELDTLKHIFSAARTELMLEAMVEDKIYLESNQCLTFFVRAIADLFPKARFVHLTRHPGDFVRSAIRKGWHLNDTIWELGRINDRSDASWQTMTQIEKLAWVWQATHGFIEGFKNSTNSEVLSLRFEDLVTQPETFQDLLSFCGVTESVKKRKFEDLFSTKVNTQVTTIYDTPNMKKVETYPKYGDWSEADKDSLRSHCAKLSEMYSYQL